MSESELELRQIESGEYALHYKGELLPAQSSTALTSLPGQGATVTVQFFVKPTDKSEFGVRIIGNGEPKESAE